MAWPYSKEVYWGHGEEPSQYDNQPMDANTLIYAGCPAGLNSGSSPASCIRPCVAGDVFAGFCVRTADNTTANAANPNLFNTQNYGDGTTGSGGAKTRLKVGGLVRLDKAQTPDTSGVVGNGVTGLAYTQADVKTKVYYNGSGFTTTSGGNTLVGTVDSVGTTPFGGSFVDIRLPIDAVRSP